MGASDRGGAQSRRLAYVLRHRPDRLPSGLAHGGWAHIDEILALEQIDRAMLEAVVAGADGRFEIADDRIRARHGHSIDVALDHPIVTPPSELFHGTSVSAIAAIRADGLLPGRRRAVHLSRTRERALRIGARHGAPVCLVVRAADAHARGLCFARVGEGDVWLVDHVPAEHIVFP